MAETEHLIITAVGPDRVGLVERLSGAVARHHANIEDSRMAAFCGEFAIIMLVSGTPAAIAAIQAAEGALAAETGLVVSARRPSAPRRAGQARPFQLSASCLDHPGVVHQLTSVLAEAGVNIDAMETRTGSAPMSGSPVFQFEARLSVGKGADLERLKQRFEAIGAERNIDIRLAPLAQG